MLYRRLVHLGETFNRFWAVNCTKMRLVAGMTKYRKGPQRTAKDHKGPQRTAQDPQKTHKGPQRTHKRPTKDRKGALRAKLQEIDTN